MDDRLTGWLPDYLIRQRWFGAKARGIARCRILDVVDLDRDHLIISSIAYDDGGGDDVYVLLAGEREIPVDDSAAIGRLDSGVWIAEVCGDPAPASWLVDAIARSRVVSSRQGGRLICSEGSAATVRIPGRDLDVRRLGAEQSNSSVRICEAFIFKLFRRMAEGENPEAEFGRFLRSSFSATPPLDGIVTYESPSGERSTVGVLQEWVPNTGDGWSHMLRLLDGEPDPESRSRLDSDSRVLGRVTAELHAALQTDESREAFRPEPITPKDIGDWIRNLDSEMDGALGLLAANRQSLDDDAKSLAEVVLSEAPRAVRRQPALSLSRAVHKIRVHGDYHLGQTLKTTTGFAIIDFEGEPARSLESRRQKMCALKDVAGMLRSFDYAIEAAAGGDAARLNRLCQSVDLRQPFLEAYFGHASATGSRAVPGAEADRSAWLRFFELEKAFYELQYELNNRPAWARIPLRAISGLIRS